MPNYLNKLPSQVAEGVLMTCCGSREWAKRMVAARPFTTREALHVASERIWNDLTPQDWLEAFSYHPRIGAPTKEIAGPHAAQEQKGVRGASHETLQALYSGNQEYEKKFGHIYLVCATGKTAEEMLKILQNRIGNDPETELRIATGEQAKITRIRLNKLIESKEI